MHVHILGICGTFMGGVAVIARELGYEVSGSDSHVYPPMSTLLEARGMTIMEGYRSVHLQPHPDCVIVGNAMSRGNPAVEYMLNARIPYASGPQWLADNLLRDRRVLAVAGTHGKTTTTSLLAWILDHAGLEPGFLIGGVTENFGSSARLGASPWFVIEADEYDTAFFDKRSKFVHYRPQVAVLNNLEYDHADIFPDIEAIRRQFHHLVRTIPGNGLIVTPHGDPELTDVLQRGCWTPCVTFGTTADSNWRARPLSADWRQFEVHEGGLMIGVADGSLVGRHNAMNALAAIAAARAAGVDPRTAIGALAQFRSVKRRLEKLAEIDGVSVYDDFSHHPTAIRLTIEALRACIGPARLVAVLEPRSNTMKLGVHRDELAPALREADAVVFLQPENLPWDLGAATAALGERRHTYHTVAAIVEHLSGTARRGDHVLIMSNGDFGDLHHRLIDALAARARP